jgi:hypothetical protein
LAIHQVVYELELISVPLLSEMPTASPPPPTASYPVGQNAVTNCTFGPAPIVVRAER